MNSPTLDRLCRLLELWHEEDGRCLAIGEQRYFDIATGRAEPTREETEVFLSSPLALEILNAAYALHIVQQRQRWPHGGAGPLFAIPQALAAAGAVDLPQLPYQIDIKDAGDRVVAHVQVDRGFDAETPYLLILELEPAEWPDRVTAGISLAVIERGVDGLLWLTGTTDQDGVVTGVWRTGREAPWDRLRRLGSSGDSLVLVQGP